MECKICGTEFNGTGVHCSDCEKILNSEKKKIAEKKVDTKVVNKKIDEVIDTKIDKVIENLDKHEVLIDFLEYMLSTGQKYVISPVHNKERILTAIKLYEETAK